MKKRITVLSIAVVAGGMTSGTWAQERRAADPTSKSAATSRAAAVESSVSGTVATVDPQTGKVEVKTGPGMATVYAAPEAVGHLKTDTRVVIDLDLASGTVSAVDPQTGTVEVKTEQGTSKVTLPPETISKLKVGDRVALEIETAHEAAAKAER